MSDCSVLLAGVGRRVPPPAGKFLPNREVVHLGSEHGAVSCHGSHEDSGSHAFCPAGAQNHPS